MPFPPMRYCPPRGTTSPSSHGAWMSSTQTWIRSARRTAIPMSSVSEAKALVVDADPALLGLLEEWLEGCGCKVVAAGQGDGAPAGPYHFIAVDGPFPRQGGMDDLRRIADRHPGTPILALSSNFFAGSGTALARALGVARVLPKPVTEEALKSAVDALLTG